MQQNDVSIQTFPTLATAINSNKFNQLSLQNGRKSFKHAFSYVKRCITRGLFWERFVILFDLILVFFFKVKKIIEV